jgi:hypothetical protein
VEGGTGGSSDTSSACRAPTGEPPPPSHEHQALVGEAVHSSVPPALFPEILLYKLPVYAWGRGKKALYDGRSSSVESDDDSDAACEDDSFYGADVNEEEEGWPLELLHQPRRPCRCRMYKHGKGELGSDAHGSEDTATMEADAQGPEGGEEAGNSRAEEESEARRPGVRRGGGGLMPGSVGEEGWAEEGRPDGVDPRMPCGLDHESWLPAFEMESPGPAIGGAGFAMGAQGSHASGVDMYGEGHNMENDWSGIGARDNFEGTTGTGHRNKRSRVQRAVIQLSEESEDIISEFESDEDEANTGDPILNDVRRDYENASWSQEFFTYEPKPRKFIGARGPHTFFALFPTILQLFHLFWPCTLLWKIVIESNHYATKPIDAQGNCMGGPKWKNLTIVGLKAYLAIHMYMGMRR